MISELCPHCGEEVKLINKFEKQYCPKCGELIKPCSLCDNDIVNCNYCEIKECKHLGKKSEYTDVHFCNIAKKYPDYLCESIKDCYYKQLLSLKEENEKLKVANEDLNDSWCDEALKIITISQQLEVAKKTLKKIANLLQVNNTIELIQSLAEIKSITEQTLKEIGE